jgi:hypothetical protein
LTSSSYKLEKYLKHTMPTSTSDYRTIFTSPTSPNYRDYVVATAAAGHVEIDSLGRTTIVWVGSGSTGISIQGGQILGTTDAVRIVLPYDDARLHAYPVKSGDLRVGRCLSCGNSIPI